MRLYSLSTSRTDPQPTRFKKLSKFSENERKRAEVERVFNGYPNFNEFLRKYHEDEIEVEELD